MPKFQPNPSFGHALFAVDCNLEKVNDSNVSVAVSLQDIQLRKAFRSSQSFDQQVVSKETMPKAMFEAYLACDKPPPLDKLNPYR